jgi:hypothetical protein
MDGSYIFTVMRLYFHKFSAIFNTLFPALSKTLCTSVVKFRATISQNVTSDARELQTNCYSASVQFVLTET